MANGGIIAGVWGEVNPFLKKMKKKFPPWIARPYAKQDETGRELIFGGVQGEL